MNKQNLIKGISAILLLITLTQCQKDDCKEKYKKNCNATEELNPVCGCNGKTYDNPSTAACYSIEEYTMGACE